MQNLVKKYREGELTIQEYCKAQAQYEFDYFTSLLEKFRNMPNDLSEKDNGVIQGLIIRSINIWKEQLEFQKEKELVRES